MTNTADVTYMKRSYVFVLMRLPFKISKPWKHWLPGAVRVVCLPYQKMGANGSFSMTKSAQN